MRELMSYLPECYDASAETRTIEEAIQPEVSALWTGRDSLRDQLDPRTATWGLAYWERALGIEVEPDKDRELRRARIVGKLQGRATTTPELVRSVAEQMLGVAVEVGEIFPEDRVEIRFQAQHSLPAGMDDLRTLLDEIMPAHLAWDYLITLTPAVHVGGHFSSSNITYLPVLEG